jgi:hypothetical protein
MRYLFIFLLMIISEASKIQRYGTEYYDDFSTIPTDVKEDSYMVLLTWIKTDGQILLLKVKMAFVYSMNMGK